MRRASRHSAPEPSRSPVKTALISIGILLLVAAVGAGVFVYFTGWSGLLGEEPPEARSENFHEPVGPAEFFPDGSAEDNYPYFTEVLKTYAEGSNAIQGQPVVDVLVEAGFDAGAMQVSFDRTETNLVADNIFVSVQIEQDCLIGQLTTGDREVTTQLAHAVGPEQNLCLIGETRPIDW